MRTEQLTIASKVGSSIIRNSSLCVQAPLLLVFKSYSLALTYCVYIVFIYSSHHGVARTGDEPFHQNRFKREISEPMHERPPDKSWSLAAQTFCARKTRKYLGPTSAILLIHNGRIISFGQVLTRAHTGWKHHRQTNSVKCGRKFMRRNCSECGRMGPIEWIEEC